MTTLMRCKSPHPRASHILCQRPKGHEEERGIRYPERHISERGQWWTEEIEANARRIAEEGAA